MLHSDLEERNVGKSLTLDILAKGQGVADRSQPTVPCLLGVTGAKMELICMFKFFLTLNHVSVLQNNRM